MGSLFVVMRTILFYLTLVSLTVVLGPVAIVAALFGARATPGSLLDRIPRAYARWLIWASGSKLRVHNAQLIRHGASSIYVSNHVSWFDVFALAAVLPSYRFIAKKELRRIPIFGPAAATARTNGPFLNGRSS